MTSTSGRDIGLAFVGGFLAALVLVMVIAVISMRMSNVYGLGHWKLNAKMPLTTMWMNLGYWTNSEGEQIQVFEEACSALLKEILSSAGLLEHDLAAKRESHRSLAILDVGFGCGDQTWELVRLTQPGGWDDFRYVGLSANQAQVQKASQKVYRELEDSDRLTSDSFKLFCANAALPDTWKPHVKAAVESLSGKDSTNRWFLALDCLYHFRPSRDPIFEYAARKLNANAMAFDLILNDKASLRDTLVLRAIGIMMGCPLWTFLTEREYRDRLVECGYVREEVILRDISEHVFPGVVEFIENQERALSQYGISLGGFKLAGRLFEWFGRSGVVKATIVVARTEGERS